MKHKFFLLLVLLLALLSACSTKIPEATVEINKDGYVIVNGEKTKYRVHTNDEISLSVDGYVVVNGEKTEYRVHSGDEIYVNEDGLLVVNGQVTQYEVDTHTPDYTVQTIPATCTQEGYDLRTCNTCGHSQKENIQPVADHIWGAEYQTSGAGHWMTCTQCGGESPIQEHADDGTGYCSHCKVPVGATEGVVYDLSDDGSFAIVIGYTGTASNVRIASEYQGKPVRLIYDNAFQGMSIASVVIPDSVTKIGVSAFELCASLTDVTIGSNVQIIDGKAFYCCGKLKTIVIPDSVEVIGSYGFANTSLVDVKLGSNLRNLGSYAFYYAPIAQIQLPDSLRYIGREAFAYCQKLQSIVIPEGVTYLGTAAFRYCEKLTDATVAGTIARIGDYTFQYCNKLQNVTIGEGVLAINSTAFEGCSLKSVSLPNSLLACGSFTNLPKEAFSVYENGLYLGNEANPYAVFVMPDNKNLTEYTLHQDTKFIMPYAFQDCSRAKTISIPDGTTAVGGNFLSGCDSLQYNEYRGGQYLGDATNPYVILVKATEAAIHPDTKIIGSGVFKDKNLGNFQVPEGVRSVGSGAFYRIRCTSLTLPDSLLSVGSLAFADINEGYYGEYVDMVLPQGLLFVEDEAFARCRILGAIRLPDTVRYIGRFSFENMYSLSDVVLSSGLTMLPDYSFNNSKMTSVLIPKSILFIGGCIFNDYNHTLRSVYYAGTQQDWEKMIISTFENDNLFTATLYFYSETQPTQTGNYWHYVDGVPTPW